MSEAQTATTEFYLTVVAPTVADFLAHPHDHRLACLACLCLSALPDHYIHAKPEYKSERRKAVKAISALRESSREENWTVGQVNDIANAIKHVIRLDTRVGYQDVDAKDIRVGNLRCGWPINGTHVMVEVKPDEEWLVSDLVAAANEWWWRKLELADGDISPIAGETPT